MRHINALESWWVEAVPAHVSTDAVTIDSGKVFVFAYLFLKHSPRVEQMAGDKKQLGLAKTKA